MTTTARPDHLAHFAADAAAVAAVLQTAPLDAAVPACPGWALRDLAVHLGYVHRWALSCVRTGEPVRAGTTPVADDDLADWFDEGAQALPAELATTDPERVCWTFAGPGTVAFWRRRVAVETAVHRVDAQSASGRARAVPDDLAEDGVAEVIEMFLPRQIGRGRTSVPTTGATLVAADSGRTWQLGAVPPTATLTGPASALLLLLWRRLARTDPVFTVTGELDALDRLLAHALTP